MAHSHDDLRKLAEAATPGPMCYRRDQDDLVAYDPGKETQTVTVIARDIRTHADGEFHAACDRETILALLDERDELRRRCETQQTELEVLRQPSRHGGGGGLVTIDLRCDDER